MTGVFYLLTICLPLATILAVFGMRYVSQAAQARARLANEGAYREIADRASAAQSETATTLASIQAALADVGPRLAAIETLLRDVG